MALSRAPRRDNCSKVSIWDVSKVLEVLTEQQAVIVWHLIIKNLKNNKFLSRSTKEKRTIASGKSYSGTFNTTAVLTHCPSRATQWLISLSTTLL